MSVRIGVDLGGTNLRVAAFRNDDTVTVRRVEVGDHRSPERMVERIAVLVEELRSELGTGEDAVPVGIGVAAMLSDRVGTVANAPNLAWFGVPFGRMLAARLGPRHRLGIYNDVNAIIWGEHQRGAARGARDVFGVYVGTGIGGGVICNDQLVEGVSNTAGEFGHVKVRWDAQAAPCKCGMRGCVEAYVGGANVLRRIHAELAQGRSAATVAIAGSIDRATPGAVDEAAAGGDEWALSLWAELGPLLGVALANAIAVLNSEVLVLGGGMLSRTPVLREHVLAALTVAAPVASMEQLSVRDPLLGDDAGLVGASLLAESGVSIVPVG